MRTRIFFGIIFALLALNVAIGVFVYTTRVAEMNNAAAVAQSTLAQQPTRAPVVGRDVPPPNPLRDGGPALPILLLLPLAMVVLIITMVVWVRSRRHAVAPDTEQLRS